MSTTEELKLPESSEPPVVANLVLYGFRSKEEDGMADLSPFVEKVAAYLKVSVCNGVLRRLAG
jgi:hypothetical protein